MNTGNFFVIDVTTLNLLSMMLGMLWGSFMYRWKALLHVVAYSVAVAIYFALKFYMQTKNV